MIFAHWCIPRDRVWLVAIADHVLTHFERHLHHAGHRLDRGGVNLIELLDPFQNTIELASHRLETLFGESNARKLCHAPNGILINGHGINFLWWSGGFATNLAGWLQAMSVISEGEKNLIVKTPAELAAALKPGERLFGLDLGEKTIGIALSDVLCTVATPLVTLAKTKFAADAAQLIELIKKHQVGGLVIGLPLNMNGTEGPSVQSARAFARNFEAKHPMPILFWDERLSTAAVTRTLIEADVSRAKRKAVVDKMAAAYILQGALDLQALTKASPKAAQ